MATNMSGILVAILIFKKKIFCANLQQILLKLVENMCLQPQIGIQLKMKKEEIRTNFVKKLDIFD